MYLRASIRDPEVLDGAHPLPDADSQTRQYRDESACAGLQHETSDIDPRGETTTGGDAGIDPVISFISLVVAAP